MVDTTVKRFALILINTDTHLGDNCIQHFHLVRYIVGCTVGNSVLWQRASGAVKSDFRTYIERFTSPNENFTYSYSHSYAHLQFYLKLKRYKPHCGSIPLNIHEVWPRPFLGGSSLQNKTPVDHSIGHISFASLEVDKRPDKIN